MSRFAEDALQVIGAGADMASDLEVLLGSEPHEADGSLIGEGEAERQALVRGMQEKADQVVTMVPSLAPFDIANEVRQMAANGCRNALGHMLFARIIHP